MAQRGEPEPGHDRERAGEVAGEVHRVRSERCAALAARRAPGRRRTGPRRPPGRREQHDTYQVACTSPPPPEAHDRLRPRSAAASTRIAASPSADRFCALPCPYGCCGRPGVRPTPTAYSVSSAAAASTPECTASARMPRLPVGSRRATRRRRGASAAPSERTRVRRADSAIRDPRPGRPAPARRLRLTA